MERCQSRGPYRSTFSIVAIDPATKQVGVAVESKSFAVGAIVPWVRAGVGAVATQARVYAPYGNRILDDLANGEKPQAALKAALESDQDLGYRQLAVVSAEGTAANYTGDKCWEWAGAVSGPGYSVQGNLITGPEVLESMADAYVNTSGSLAVRLLTSLQAGQEAGGDRRGQQSAALVVEESGYEKTTGAGTSRLVDLRVDDHEEPIKELGRLLGIWRANNLSEEAMQSYHDEDYPAAVALMLKANQLAPNTAGILYDLACFECLSDLFTDSLNHLRKAIQLEPKWAQSAREDSDFDALRETPEFAKITTP